jgi:hypothetical protein
MIGILATGCIFDKTYDEISGMDTVRQDRETGVFEEMEQG